MPKPISSLLTLSPTIRNYVWGGQSLLSLVGPNAAWDGKPISEVWSLYERNPVTNAEFTGRTLAEIVTEYPNEILGELTVSKGNKRFPLLIKLLDCASWLSLQVHPNNEQALQLEGLNFIGKTEAWHILNAEPDSHLIAGIKAGTSIETLHAAIGNETILDLVEYHKVQNDDTIFVPAGTIHALGPGLLIYEVQQTSDITYRIFDWNRPQNNGRTLHIEKSTAVTDPLSQGKIFHHQKTGGPVTSLVKCPYFHLEKLSGTQERDTKGLSFHALTVTDGEARVSSLGSDVVLRKFDSVLVPAVSGKYRLDGVFQILCSSVSE